METWDDPRINWAIIRKLFQQYLDFKPGYIGGGLRYYSIPEWMAEREQAYSSFSPHLEQDNLENVEAVSQAYRCWLRASNNKSWTNMQRVGVRALDQPEKLCKLLSFIQQETVPIEKRIQEGLAGRYKVKGIGKAILTGLLHTMYPERYGVWNGSTIKAFEKLDIYIPLMTSIKQGRTYVRINAVLNDMTSHLDTNLTFVDGFMWYVATKLPREKSTRARANEDELLSGRKVSQKIDVLKSILISKATGREANDDTYKNLREELLTIPQIQDELPEFIFHIENLIDFWNFIQPQSRTYRGRREYLHDAFSSVLTFLEVNPIRTEEEVERPSIFLAHSSKDKFFVRRLAEVLRQNGVNIWIDEAEIKVGDSLTEKIGAAIIETDYFGVILSHNSVNSEWVQRELQIAIQKELQEGQVIVLPILMEPVEIPPFLVDKLYADFSTPDKFESSVIKLLDSLGIKSIEVTRKEEKQTETVWVSEPEDLLMGFEDIRIVGLDESKTYNPDPSNLLYNVYLALSSEPSSDWVEIFNAERRFPRHTMWRRAWIEGNNIVVHCPLDELEKYHLKDLKKDAETTNKKYRQYLGERAQEKAKTELMERKESDSLMELKRRLKFE